MNYITRSRFGISQLELWFDEIPERVHADVILHKHSAQNRLGARPLYTLVHSLTEDEAQIFTRIQKRSQTEIRRGDREGLKFTSHQINSASIEDFCEFYNEFAREKNKETISKAQLENLARAGMLKLTTADKDGYPLAWHSYVYTCRRARLLHSASHFRAADQSVRNAIARANRWLHWQDILYFKRLGLQEYDFGGWYNGEEDIEKLRINKFKESFGAEVKPNYNVVYATTLKGEVYLRFLPLYARVLGWLRKMDKSPDFRRVHVHQLSQAAAPNQAISETTS